MQSKTSLQGGLYGDRCLTLRQYQIAKLVTDGMKNQEISDALGISRHVVKNNIKQIFNKTGMSNRVELALWCITHLGY